MAKQKTESLTLPADDRARLLSAIEQNGVAAIVRWVGVSREALTRAAAGFPVRKGTLVVLRAATFDRARSASGGSATSMIDQFLDELGDVLDNADRKEFAKLLLAAATAPDDEVAWRPMIRARRLIERARIIREQRG